MISFFVRRGRFSVPTFILPEHRAQQQSRLAVAAGERQRLYVARPCLDGGEHGARLMRSGRVGAVSGVT